MSDRVQLDYEPGAPIRRRKALRRLVASLAFIALVAALWFEGPVAYHKLLRAYWEHRVANYIAPADRVVYEEDPARWPALLPQPGYQKMNASLPSSHFAVAYSPKLLERFNQVSPVQTRGTALFAHSRRMPDGQEQLIVVWLDPYGLFYFDHPALPDNQMLLELSTTVVDGARATLYEQGLQIEMQPAAVNPPFYARFYAGQVDPTDATHFTIPYELGGCADVLDGYLRNDNSVLLYPRKYDDLLKPKRPPSVRPGG